MSAANRVFYTVGYLAAPVCIVGAVFDRNWLAALGWFSALCWTTTALINEKRADLR